VRVARLIVKSSDPSSSVERSRGKITLVGAGPGDPDLLTVKALRILESADVVFFDDLVAPEILELLPARVRCIYVGKPHHAAVITQDEIITQILAAAHAGLHAVRLKSGDPMIFGRSGEELAAAHAAGIPIEVVPGVTAAGGAAASTRISLTHRDYAQQVSFLTAVRRNGVLADVRGLAGVGKTLVVYMGLVRAPELSAALGADGVAANWPVAIVENATRPGERVILTTVGDLGPTVVRENIRTPALFIIGEVVKTYAADVMPASAAVETVSAFA